MTRLVVLDTETTGLETTDQVVELATVLLSADGEDEWWRSLVRPTVPISAGARGVHHISDEELADAPTMADLVELWTRVGTPWPPDAVLVGHNLEFDARMLLQSGVPEIVLPPRRICTYRCLLHLRPELGSHKNQSLRYSLGLTVPAVDGPAHRALPDAVLTAEILRWCLAEETSESLIELTTTPILLQKVQFGRNRGRPWSEMNAGFLRWVLDRDFRSDVIHTARHHLNRLTLRP